MIQTLKKDKPKHPQRQVNKKYFPLRQLAIYNGKKTFIIKMGFSIYDYYSHINAWKLNLKTWTTLIMTSFPLGQWLD